MIEANMHYLVLGVGGIGSKSAQALASRATTEFGNNAVHILTMDADHGAGHSQTQDHVHLNIAQNASSFFSEARKQEEFEGQLQPALANLGRRLLRETPEISSRIKHIADIVQRKGLPLTVVILGSIIGGTCSGILPVVAEATRKCMPRTIQVTVLGFGGVATSPMHAFEEITEQNL